MGVWTTVETVPGLSIHTAATVRGLFRLSLNNSDKKFFAELSRTKPSVAWWRDDQHPLLIETAHQLQAYFRGRLQEFDLRLDLHGTRFQEKVWRALRSIPYGETRSYKDIARQIGSPKATRAVGGANGRNPIAVVIPCHRVIAADGSLGGYGCGLPIKKLLLKLEATARKPSGSGGHPISRAARG